MSSTLAGNLTVIGWEYAKAGVPLTLLTLAVGIWMLK
jgi:hypothetical protein